MEAEIEEKRMRLEAELDDRRREQERKHDEKMMMMMMGFMQQMAGFSPLPSHSAGPAQLPYPPYPPTSPYHYSFNPPYPPDANDSD